jgi:hypothetical protein
VIEGEATEYKMIKYNWGGLFFFKNSISIAKNLFDNETRG